MNNPDRERGFVLIIALWFLLLGGSIVAILLTRSASANRQANDQADRLVSRWAAESAIQIAFADVLSKGAGSRWWALPANGSVQVGDKSVALDITSEASRLDLNEANVKVVDDWLRAQGVASAERERFAAQLQLQRVAGRLASFAEIRSLAARTLGPQQGCLASSMTLYSGRSTSLGDRESATFLGESATRVAATTDKASATQILRFDVSAKPPIRLFEIEISNNC